MLEEFSTFYFISCSKLVQQNVVCCTSSTVARAQSSVRPLICIRGEVEAEVCEEDGGREANCQQLVRRVSLGDMELTDVVMVLSVLTLQTVQSGPDQHEKKIEANLFLSSSIIQSSDCINPYKMS